MTFVRLLLEYSCDVWGSCTVADAVRPEQLQLAAARIVTGLTAYASVSSLYAETGWDKLNTRRKIRKLSLFITLFAGYIGITVRPSVRPSMYLVSATPP